MKERIIKEIEKQSAHFFELACKIFDNPECGDEAVYASGLLTEELKNQGFTVEAPVGGLNTSFRAVWKKGEGGPNVGFLGEYDALRNQGHACAHHMQTPAAIAAAVALKNILSESDLPFTLTVYGTPAEETFGGKIVMAENGCFRELDVAFATHAGSGRGAVTGSGMALWSYKVDFYGKKAHASGAPHEGRSAADAMLLAFQGVEFLREHVKEETRMHYSIREGTGPTNVVCDHAVAGFTLRYPDDRYLEELDSRFRDIIKGACLMTGTTAEIKPGRAFSAGKDNEALADIIRDNYLYNGLEVSDRFVASAKGSSDVYNVATLVPATMCNVYFHDSPAHSQDWVDAGKSEQARICILNSAKLVASTAYDLISDPEKLNAVKASFASN